MKWREVTFAEVLEFARTRTASVEKMPMPPTKILNWSYEAAAFDDGSAVAVAADAWKGRYGVEIDGPEFWIGEP